TEKQRIMYQLAGNIAHELRTPLLSISSAARGAGRYLPQLVSAYRGLERDDTTAAPAIRDSHLAIMESALEDIATETGHALTMIDILLTNIGPEYSDDGRSWQLPSIRSCIAEALQRYPLRDEQRRLVDLAGNEDFPFRGSRPLLVHVFFKLLKNAVYALSA